MHIIAPHHKKFIVSKVLELIFSMADNASTLGTVLILDILKKFKDLIDKRTDSWFGVAAQGFISADGILLPWYIPTSMLERIVKLFIQVLVILWITKIVVLLFIKSL